MFPHGYFPAGVFAPDYFPPVTTPAPATSPGGGYYRNRTVPRPQRVPVPTDDQFGDDDFLAWFT